MTPVTQTHHLPSPFYQPAVLYTHSLTFTLKKSYYRQMNGNIFLTLCLRQTSLYIVHVIPRPINIVMI